MVNSTDQDRMETNPCGSGSALLNVGTGLPAVIASWCSYPPHIVDDSALIGGKAKGLLTLPREWVPPFLVFTKAFCSQWSKVKSAAALLRTLRAEEQSLVEYFYTSLPNGNESRVLVRSNAPSEDLSWRGAYQSYTAGPNWNETATAIDRILADVQSTDMYVLVQTAIDPSWGGHMSNERRVTDDRRRWLIEGLGESTDFDQRFIRASLPPERPQPLLASDTKQLASALRMVAGELLRRKPKRYHCEWAWGGNRLWVVQCDEALEECCEQRLPTSTSQRATHRSRSLSPTHLSNTLQTSIGNLGQSFDVQALLGGLNSLARISTSYRLRTLSTVPGLQPKSSAIEFFDRPTAVIRISVALRNTSASVVPNRK